MNKKNSKRFNRERDTINKMIRIYCRGRHNSKEGLCFECKELSQYAMKRLEYCPFKKFKPTCNKCPIHCYSESMRQRVKTVMRYSGPKMLFYHPLATIMHYFDSYQSYKAEK